MSNLTTVVNSIVSKVNTHTTDLSNKATQISTHIPLSGITAYHLLQGNLVVSNYTITQGFNTTLYTGNGGTQSITTGVDMATQWGNDASEKFGGLVWIKGRSVVSDNNLVDSVRGVSNAIFTNLDSAQVNAASNINVLLNNGFTTGSSSVTNASGATYTSWNFQTTHRISGVTNHGKPYTCHYNPYTGFTIVKYEGSGLAGHEIPHHLGRKLGFATVKCISTINDWFASYLDSFGTQRLKLNSADASTTETTVFSNNTNDNVIISTSNASNGTGNYYIMYGWANSYFDESNKLIGNYEIGVYQGTGASGNKVTTRGKPAWIMIKRLDSTGDWIIQDNVRPIGSWIRANLLNAEYAVGYFGINSDGFTLNGTAGDAGTINVSGGQYLYMVAYDTNSNGGGSYYPLASDTANLQVNNAIIPFANGVDTNGTKITTLSKNETISGLTLTAGKNYVYSKNDGTYGVSKYAPCYGLVPTRSKAGETPDFFDVAKNKWFTTTGGAELVTNGTFDSNTNGWTGRIPGTGTLTVLNGSLLINASTAYYWAEQTISGLTVGKKYYIHTNVSAGTASTLYIELVNGTKIDGPYFRTISNVAYGYFIAETQSVVIRLVQAETGTSYWDNVTLFEAEPTIGTEITTSRNYLNHIVYADNDGGVLYVEELPKIEYKDIVKANEFKGKNACTAWVNFDGTTTPPTIKDSYNVSSVVRTATGKFDIYFKQIMDNDSYSANVYGTPVNRIAERSEVAVKYINKVTIWHRDEANTFTNNTVNDVQIFGGKN